MQELYPERRPRLTEAQAFLEDFRARHGTEETESGVDRRTELTGSDFTASALTALLPGTSFDVHIAKMTDGARTGSGAGPAARLDFVQQFLNRVFVFQ